MSSKTESITCPHCGAKNTWTPENKFRSFCSHRCKLIDLGDWASENHKIAGDDISSSDIKPSEEDSE
jgi:endogenous inhibitor of DNA gyrase (YacG/DUF329 family)